MNALKGDHKSRETHTPFTQRELGLKKQHFMLRGLIRRIGAIRSASARDASRYVLFFLIYVSHKEYPEFWIRIRMDSHLFVSFRSSSNNKVDYNEKVKYMTLSLIPYYSKILL